MREVFILVPVLQIDEELSLEWQVERLIKIPRNQFLVHELDNRISAIQIEDFSLSFLEINDLLTQRTDLELRMKMMEQTILNYQVSQEPPSHGGNLESLIRKAKKYKEVKQQNKKLRKLLQIQLQNTEKVRQQTQRTMRTLKQEFDALVGEMNRQNSNNHSRNTAHQKTNSGQKPQYIQTKYVHQHHRS